MHSIENAGPWNRLSAWDFTSRSGGLQKEVRVTAATGLGETPSREAARDVKETAADGQRHMGPVDAPTENRKAMSEEGQ